MLRHLSWWSFICGLPITLLVFSSCGDIAREQHPLTIAGAANLRHALEEVTQQFTAQTGITTNITLASSGKLTAQIKAGAPYDVFLSADQQYPAELAAAGLTKGTPKTYAFGPLALWTTTSNIPLLADSLDLPRIKKIALPNPATAPYGRAAMAFLKQQGLDGILANKLVFGESVGQANQFVYSGVAEVGITALASVTVSDKWHKYALLADHPPVEQTGVIIKASSQREAADSFLEYLLSPAGQSILKKFGYFTAE